MKKIFALLLALLLAFGFVACDENDDPESSTPIQNINFGEIFSGTSATVWGKQDAATKQAIIAEGKKDGIDITFGADGSMTIYDPETGETITQKSDGTWTFSDKEGNEGQMGGNWPDNEFTKLLPKPSFTLLAATTESDMFTVAFSGVTAEQVKGYVEQLKAAGFTVDAETTDNAYGDIVVYLYSASNAAGYTVEVSYTMGTSGLTLTKPVA